MIGNHRNFLFGDAFNQWNVVGLFVVTKRQCDAARFGTASPSDAVNVGFWFIGNFKVNHVGDIIDIYSARC